MLDHLDPISVWILNERQMVHPAVFRAFDEFITRRVKIGDALRQAVDCDANMAKPTRLRISVVVARKIGIRLSAVIMRQF